MIPRSTSPFCVSWNTTRAADSSPARRRRCREATYELRLWAHPGHSGVPDRSPPREGVPWQPLVSGAPRSFRAVLRQGVQAADRCRPHRRAQKASLPFGRIASRLLKASIVAPASTRYLTADDPTTRSRMASRDDAAMPNIPSRSRRRMTTSFDPAPDSACDARGGSPVPSIRANSKARQIFPVLFQIGDLSRVRSAYRRNQGAQTPHGGDLRELSIT